MARSRLACLLVLALVLAAAAPAAAGAARPKQPTRTQVAGTTAILVALRAHQRHYRVDVLRALYLLRTAGCRRSTPRRLRCAFTYGGDAGPAFSLAGTVTLSGARLRYDFSGWRYDLIDDPYACVEERPLRWRGAARLPRRIATKDGLLLYRSLDRGVRGRAPRFDCSTEGDLARLTAQFRPAADLALREWLRGNAQYAELLGAAPATGLTCEFLDREIAAGNGTCGLVFDTYLAGSRYDPAERCQVTVVAGFEDEQLDVVEVSRDSPSCDGRDAKPAPDRGWESNTQG